MNESLINESEFEIKTCVDGDEYSDPINGTTIGYFTFLKKAGRNKCYQQKYMVRCECCKQIFIKTLGKIKEEQGRSTCRHTRRTTKPATAPHPCALCGQMTTNLKYCSSSCKTTDINMRTKKKPPKLCLLCGKPTPNRNSNLCSPECRRLHRLKLMYGFDVEHMVDRGVTNGD